MKKICLCMPSYGRVEPETMVSALVMSLHRPELIHAIRTKNLMYVDRARNELVKENLADDGFTHYGWLDSDMVWEPDMLERLLAHDKPVVGANYFAKMTARMIPGNFANFPDDKTKAIRWFTELPTGLVPCDCLGMGACLIEKTIFAEMSDYFDDERWFRAGDEEKFFGEDNHFFWRLKEMHIPVYLDGSLTCGHLSPSRMVTVADWKAQWGKPKIKDWPGDPCDFEDLYRKVVTGFGPLAIAVEVGSFMGRSAVIMGNLIKEQRKQGKDIAFYCVDNFMGSDDAVHQQIVKENGGSFRNIFENNLRDHGVHNVVRIIEGDSAKSAEQFADHSLDFVFIDAEHDFKSVSQDIKAWTPKVKSGGVIAGHDFDWAGVKTAVNLWLPDAVPHGEHCWLWRKP